MTTEPSRDLLAINLNRLEDECKDQPQLMFTWGQELAKARRVSKAAKNRMKLAEVAADKAAREDPFATMGIAKTTEPAIKAYVAGDEEYRQCQQDLIDSEYEEDVLAAFVESLRDRREQLGNEVKLHGQMYWSKPDTNAAPTDQQRMNATQAASKAATKRRF